MAKKKKMTPAQAAAARRPENQELPQNSSKTSKKRTQIEVGPRSTVNAVKDKGNRSIFIVFAIIFVLAAIAAPFLVIFFSRLLGM